MAKIHVRYGIHVDRPCVPETGSFRDLPTVRCEDEVAVPGERSRTILARNRPTPGPPMIPARNTDTFT